jgi:hypothetical protein
MAQKEQPPAAVSTVSDDPIIDAALIPSPG